MKNDVCEVVPKHEGKFIVTSLDGYKDCLTQWWCWGRGLHTIAWWVCSAWEGVPCMQIEENLVRA